MAKKRIVESLFLSACLVLVAGCASQPAAKASLDDRYFEREASKYLKFQHDGQTVYCQNDARAASLVPYKWCITESALRHRVESTRLARNPVTRGGPGYVATVPGAVSGR